MTCKNTTFHLMTINKPKKLRALSGDFGEIAEYM
jgi:hypothetical protein